MIVDLTRRSSEWIRPGTSRSTATTLITLNRRIRCHCAAAAALVAVSCIGASVARRSVGLGALEQRAVDEQQRDQRDLYPKHRRRQKVLEIRECHGDPGDEQHNECRSARADVRRTLQRVAAHARQGDSRRRGASSDRRRSPARRRRTSRRRAMSSRWWRSPWSDYRARSRIRTVVRVRECRSSCASISLSRTTSTPCRRCSTRSSQARRFDGGCRRHDCALRHRQSRPSRESPRRRRA